MEFLSFAVHALCTTWAHPRDPHPATTGRPKAHCRFSTPLRKADSRSDQHEQGLSTVSTEPVNTVDLYMSQTSVNFSARPWLGTTPLRHRSPARSHLRSTARPSSREQHRNSRQTQPGGRPARFLGITRNDSRCELVSVHGRMLSPGPCATRAARRTPRVRQAPLAARHGGHVTTPARVARPTAVAARTRPRHRTARPSATKNSHHRTPSAPRTLRPPPQATAGGDHP